ncbi:type 2 lanthipeptide synthetase LanM family protein [Nonomuraea angiospora]|uniref:type 2 lanthipeptide synthetase LanM family protein n=1 Tax=Nonomuraea angiospora TaxID=46172 RepID=UPI003789D8E4
MPLPGFAGSRPPAPARDLLPYWWSPGLTLAERLALPGRAPSVQPTANGTGGADGRRLRRWQEWLAAAPGTFASMLAARGLTETGLRDLLHEDPEHLARRAGMDAPRWARTVREVLDAAGEPPHLRGSETAWDAGFGTIVSPFVRHAAERLTSAAEARGLDGEAARPALARRLEQHLVILAARTLVLELNVMRVTGRLSGDTPADRFVSFVERLSTRAGLAALLSEYVVLARLLAQAADQAVETCLELLERLESDRDRIVAGIFGGADPGRLRAVEAGGVGDAHQGGRSVALLAFESGARLVYKPRPLAAHRHANDAIRWLDGRLPGYGLRTLAVLDRGAYGWLEFAEHEPCADRDGVARFHRRQGALLALLHALDGADFHFENLIACGDQPLLVDLEAILHPAVHERANPDPALTALDESVARVGLLPSVVWSEDGGAADLGGVGGDAGAVLPFKSVRWAGAGTDEMRLTREHEVLPGSRNRPVLEGRAVGPGEFAQELRAGFRAAYRAIAAGRDELDGLLDAFAGDTVRVVMRGTQLYGTLLLESTHPDVMRDALDRDRVLDHLRVASAGDPARLRLVEAEIADLWSGDIPLFTTRPESTSVWSGRGVPFDGVLRQESLAHARAKLAGMGERDLAVQDWVVQASMATRADSPPLEPVPAGSVGQPSDPGRAFDAACRIADTLAELAHVDGGRAGWLGVEPVAENRWAIRPLVLDLYSGTTGVALFLGELAALSGEQRHADLARRALSGAVAAVEQVTSYAAGLSCGAFDGYVGLAYTLARVGPLLGEGELVALVEPLLTALAPAVARDGTLDVVGGAAGALAASLAILDATGLPIAARLAKACADRLVETAEPQDHGVAWRGAVPAVHPLTGFSHGTAGIGWALACYAIATGEPRYGRIASAAFAYERARFDPRLGDWPDHREKPHPLGGSGQGPVRAWCHGAPGIGLSRADLLRHLTTRPATSAAGPGVAAAPLAVDLDPALPGVDIAPLTEDLDRALTSYLATAPGSIGHSLCHGELGNLDLLTTAIAAGRTELTAERDRRLSAVLDQLATGPRCGTPVAVPIPGLMTGLAGIGHGLLRHAFPARVPSVLLLQP